MVISNKWAHICKKSENEIIDTNFLLVLYKKLPWKAINTTEIPNYDPL